MFIQERRETLQRGRCPAGDCKPPVLGKDGRKGLELGPRSSPVVYSHSIVTIGLSLTLFAVLRLVTDRQSGGRNGLANGGIMH